MHNSITHKTAKNKRLQKKSPFFRHSCIIRHSRKKNAYVWRKNGCAKGSIWRGNGRKYAGNRQDTVIQLMDFFEQNELYLKALLGTNGSIHFMDRQKDELVQYLDVRLLEVSGRIKPYVMEHHMTTTVSFFRLWIARGKTFRRKNCFN